MSVCAVVAAVGAVIGASAIRARREPLSPVAAVGEPVELSARLGQLGASPGRVRGSVSTLTPPSSSIVSRLDRSIVLGDRGQGVRTTSAISRPAVRAASIVSSVWLIVPRPGGAAIDERQASSTARSRTR